MRGQKWLVSILFLWWLQPRSSQRHKGVKELSPLIVNSSLEPSSPWSTLNDCFSPTLQPARNLIDVANTIISEHAEMRCISCHTGFLGFLLGCHWTKGCWTSRFPSHCCKDHKGGSALHTTHNGMQYRVGKAVLTPRPGLVRCHHWGLWTCV